MEIIYVVICLRCIRVQTQGDAATHAPMGRP